jgi:hypothetical protein
MKDSEIEREQGGDELRKAIQITTTDLHRSV